MRHGLCSLIRAYIRECPHRLEEHTPPDYYETMSSQMTTLRFTAKCSPSQHRRLDEGLRVPAARFCDRNGRLAAAVAGGKVVELRVVRTPLRVELHVVVGHDADTTVVSAPLNPVGIDKGLSTRMALSDGRYVSARTIDNQVVRRYQRRLARAQRGSRSRAKKRAAVARVRRREY